MVRGSKGIPELKKQMFFTRFGGGVGWGDWGLQGSSKVSKTNVLNTFPGWGGVVRGFKGLRKFQKQMCVH